MSEVKNCSKWKTKIFLLLQKLLLPLLSASKKLFVQKTSEIWFFVFEGGRVETTVLDRMHWPESIKLKVKKFISLMWFVKIIFCLQKVGVAATFAIMENFFFFHFGHFLTLLNALLWIYQKGQIDTKKCMACALSKSFNGI